MRESVGMTERARPRRSCLYMPGSNARAMEKAKTLDADVVLFDLEDSVAPDAKEAAREAVAGAIRAGGYGDRELVVRINGVGSPWIEEDLAAVRDSRPDAVLLPKVEQAEDVDKASEAGLPVWAMIETPRAILGVDAIAAAPALSVMVVGTNDLAKEMGARLTPGREAFQTALSMTVLAARAHGRTAIDGVYNAIGDEEGLTAECEQGLTLGFDGKTLIHPSQLAACNRIFSPSEEALAEARAVIAAFADPANKGAGVLKVDGKMAERLHLEQAEALVAMADAIAAREAR